MKREKGKRDFLPIQAILASVRVPKRLSLSLSLSYGCAYVCSCARTSNVELNRIESETRLNVGQMFDGRRFCFFALLVQRENSVRTNNTKNVHEINAPKTNGLCDFAPVISPLCFQRFVLVDFRSSIRTF